MTIDPQIAVILAQLNTLPALETLSPVDARALLTEVGKVAPPGPEIARVEDRAIDTAAGALPVRIYAATADASTLLVYFHGGGWTLGTLDSVDALMRELAVLADACIVSVDYRLAPEHPFPAALDDAVAALRWAADNRADLAPGARLIIGGDSAGGNLAAVTAILMRDAGGPAIDGQLLFYPVTDADFDTPSYHANGEGYFLTTAMMRWFWDQYQPDRDARSDPRLSPLRTADLSGLPPALIQTAGFDPLRDEGEAYAARLRDAGVSVTLEQRAELIHGYVGMRTAEAANQAVSDAAAWVLGLGNLR